MTDESKTASIRDRFWIHQCYSGCSSSCYCLKCIQHSFPFKRRA